MARFRAGIGAAMLSQQRGGVCDDGGEDQHDEPLTSGKAGVEQVPLQYGVAPGHDGNDHRWIFRALALVDGHCVGGAMNGRAARERRTSLFYAELGANLCDQVFQLLHFSFETRDVDLHRREFRDAEGWRRSR